MKHFMSQDSHIQIAKEVGVVKNEVGPRLFFVDDQTLMKIVALFGKLYDHSLVVLRRSRDKEKGWFVYHWRLQPDQFAGFITSMKRRVLERLKTRLRYEMKHEFYTCQTPGCKRYTFEEAIEFLFKCPICHKPMIHLNYNCFIKVLIRKIEQIEKELSE